MEKRFGKPARRWAAALAVVLWGYGGNASATLIDRGSGMIYDDQLDITWLQDANYAQTSGFDADGLMTWSAANAWAAGLVYGGFDDWRLARINLTSPTPSPHDCSDHNAATCMASGNELAFMYYINFAGNSGDNKTGDQTAGGVTLENVQPVYWSATEFTPTSIAWNFLFQNGNTGISAESIGRYAWAVRTGDVAAAPEPTSLLLLGVGALGLGWSRRREAAALIIRSFG